ncbi:mandelate racemase/muconate lactonizing enzyme family protein [Rhodoligotrophos defluvii]|uniref:mandelate racemase/muconate lactonizing enzyme family protein n=1 Tax=Rhodoligotrophos defluvii TaxID=2561934 RepID=UPI0010C9F589|nr:mandelate racemase/muconate lactonizing enzyme family protein [Rhodoligotrophos defluvii]
MSNISAVRLYRADLPLRVGLKHASASEAALEEVFLRVETSTGEFGMAEVRGNGAYATGAGTATVLRETEEAVVGALLGCRLADAPQRIAALSCKPLVKALADSAVHDALAREAGQPLCQFLGASPPDAIATHAQIGFCALDDAVSRAQAAVEQGFRRLKVRVGRPSAEADIDILRALRETVGKEVALAIDANGGWDAEKAIFVLRAIGASDIAWAEQPTPSGDDEALRRVLESTDIPIIGDESIRTAADIERLSRLEAIDGVHLKLEKAGTIANLMHLTHRAREAGLKVCIGQMDQGRLGSSITAHLAASIDAQAYELWGFQHVIADVATGLDIRNGSMMVPSGPGTGVTVDMDRLTLVREFA